MNENTYYFYSPLSQKFSLSFRIMQGAHLNRDNIAVLS